MTSQQVSQPATQPTDTAPRALAASVLARVPAAVLGLAGATAVVDGVRRTWISTFAGLITQSGWGTRNGDILVAGAIVAALLAVVSLLFASTVARWLLALTGLAVAGYAGYLLIQLYTVAQQLDGMALGAKGPGLYLATVGGALIFLTMFLPMPATEVVATESVSAAVAPTPGSSDSRAPVALSWLFTGLGSRLRYPAAVLAVVAGLAHVPVTPQHLREAPYIGVLFICLTVVCVIFSSWLLIQDSAVAWGVLGVSCLLAVIAYVVSRTVGLPLIGDDVGNWFETLGVVSVLTETGVVLLSAAALHKAAFGRYAASARRRHSSVLTTQ